MRELVDWLSGTGLEVVLIILGSVLLARFVAWVGRHMPTFARAFLIVANTSASFSFFASAFVNASWMTGPSAIGSENGMPTSTMFAPACSSAGRSFSVVARSG